MASRARRRDASLRSSSFLWLGSFFVVIMIWSVIGPGSSGLILGASFASWGQSGTLKEGTKDSDAVHLKSNSFVPHFT